MYSHLVDYFPDFEGNIAVWLATGPFQINTLINCTGAKQDDIAAKNYILKKYLAENPDPDRTCYSHFTTATGNIYLLLCFECEFCL